MSLLTIVHTGDLHNHLTEQKAAKLKELRQSADFLFDSGDAVKSGNIFFNVFGEKAQRLMNKAGYDAACVGNREYHFSKFAMKCKLKNANFPFVSANYCWSNERMFEEYESYLVKGCEVFVFGLSNINISEDMKISKYSDQYQTDPLKRAEKIAIEFEQTPAQSSDRIMIALTHVGLERDKEIAKSLEGRIAIIFGGHSHDICYGTVCGTHIIHSGFYGDFASKLTYDTETKKITAFERIKL